MINQNLPLRTITHRENKLQRHEQHTSITKDIEYVLAHVMSEWINIWVRQGSSNEVECQVEIGLPNVRRVCQPGKGRLTNPKYVKSN